MRGDSLTLDEARQGAAFPTGLPVALCSDGQSVVDGVLHEGRFLPEKVVWPGALWLNQT